MEVQDTSAAIYSEAKSEYTKQLVFNFQPVLLRFFLDRYTDAKTSAAVTAKTKSSLSEFQDSLSQIPEWNLDKVQRETTSLLQSVHCDYIEDLITAVFIAHTKILSAIRLHSKPRRKIQITIPKPDHFMHRALSECSRLLWSNVYLFSDSVSSLERQKNTNDMNRFLEEGILQAIRNLLPVKSILRDSLQEDDDDAVQITSRGDNDAELLNTGTPSVSEEIDTSLTTENVNTPSVDQALPELPVMPVMPLLSVLPELPVMPESSTIEEVKTSDAPLLESLSPTSMPEPTNTFIVDTEKSVGFTGVDSIFTANGDAELRDMIDETSDEFKIVGESESLDFNEFEDLDNPAPVIPLGADDYETL